MRIRFLEASGDCMMKFTVWESNVIASKSKALKCLCMNDWTFVHVTLVLDGTVCCNWASHLDRIAVRVTRPKACCVHKIEDISHHKHDECNT